MSTAAHTPAARVRRSTARSRARPWEWSLGNFVTFAAPTLLWFEINVVGRLFATELILLTALPLLLVSGGGRLAARRPGMILLLAGLWLASLVLSDIVNESAFEDYTRGWSKIVFFMLNFAAIHLLIAGRPERIVLFSAGLALGGLLQYYLAPSELAAVMPWKFGLSGPLTGFTMVCATLLYVRGYVALSLAAIAIIAGANLYLGSRGAALINMLAFVYIASHVWVARTGMRRLREHPGRVTLAALLLCVSVFGFASLYEYAAPRGYLGAEAAEKFIDQGTGDFGLFLGGRSEILASAEAIADAPWLGHGSWARNPQFAALLIQRKLELGYAVYGGESDNEDLIPTHSYFFGSWVEGGLLGGLFWLVAAALMASGLLRCWRQGDPLLPLLGATGIAFLWACAFSPFGGHERMYAAFALVVGLYMLRPAGEAGSRR